MLKFTCTLHIVDITSRNILGTSSAHQKEIYCYMHMRMGVSFNEIVNKVSSKSNSSDFDTVLLLISTCIV
jgi:hypothetical protein